MAGKLVIDTLQDSSGNNASATDAIKGSARAWVNFNGVTTATIRASYNVSSVTRNSTGDYTINFTNALTDANYVPLLSGLGANTSNLTGGYVVKGAQGSGATLKSTTQLGIQSGSSANGSTIDAYEVYVAIFR